MERDAVFESLEEAVVACRLCPRLVEWRELVARGKVRRFLDQEYWGRPVPAFGTAAGALILIGLAPAAHGGNRTGRMFTGDRSGDWLFEALHHFGFASAASSRDRHDGLRVSDCLITAALRCAPPKNKPLPSELKNCRAHLRRELQLASSVRVVIVLGRIAFGAFLEAWGENGHAIPKPKPKFRHGEEWKLPGGIVLIASYHPSQQNTLTGRLTRPMFHAVFRRARVLLDQPHG